MQSTFGAWHTEILCLLLLSYTLTLARFEQAFSDPKHCALPDELHRCTTVKIGILVEDNKEWRLDALWAQK